MPRYFIGSTPPNPNTLLLDQFSRYANNMVMDGVVPIIGPAWHATGANLPTIASGLLESSGTGYLATTALLSPLPAKILAAASFSGGTDLTQKGMTFGLSPDTPFALNNLLHLNYGPQAFTLMIRQGGGSFVPIMQNNWVSAVTNDGSLRQVMLLIHSNTVTVIDWNGNTYSVTDPNVSSLAGGTVFFEPNKQADGLQAGVSGVLAEASANFLAGFTTLDPNNKTSTITLSNGNLTATNNTATAEPQVFSIAPRSHGKVHFEFTVNVRSTPGTPNMGIGFASFTQHALNQYLGSDFKSVGFWPAASGVANNIYLGASATNLGNNMGFSVGDIYAVEIDFDAMKFWVENVTKNTGYNNDVLANQNPANGIGGFSFATAGGAPYGIVLNIEALNDAITLNPGSSPFAKTPSINYIPWLQP